MNIERNNLRPSREAIHERREKRRVLRPRPGFEPGTEIPEVPDGMTLVKFFGKPAFIPAIQEGDTMYGKSQFSVRQVLALRDLYMQTEDYHQKMSGIIFRAKKG